MKDFLDNDFLLQSQTAKQLYHDFAEDMPIFDFHCHISCKEIYEDKKYDNITQVWLYGDHYKWRLMREAGIDEDQITGKADDYTKFLNYASVMPFALGNPLYAWSHLELRRFFGINDLLCKENAETIYRKANEKLASLSARKLIKMSNVATIFTTDDPTDDLKYHLLLAQDKTFDTKVCPTFRPDKCFNIELPTFIDYIEKLSQVTNIKIDTVNALEEALVARMDHFEKAGCCCSDHALDTVMYAPCSAIEAGFILKHALMGNSLSQEEISKFKGHILTFLGKEYSRRGWVMQYHIGALRNTSSRYMQLLGADTGFDATEDRFVARPLAQLLDTMDRQDCLPKTVLYCLNPADNDVLAVLKNCFQGGCVGKIQFGSAWWHCDHKGGMERQLETLMQTGLMSKFIGMLTDSRSFLSYTRHEYFRRILCNLIGDLVESGQYPYDLNVLGKIVEDICYTNAVNYFKK